MFNFLILGVISLLILIVMIFKGKNFHQVMLVDAFFFGIFAYYLGSLIAFLFLDQFLNYGTEVIELSSIAFFSSTIYFYFIKRKSFVLKNFGDSKNLNLIFLVFFFIVSFNFLFSILIYRDFFMGNSLSQILSGDLLYVRKMITSGDSGYYFPGLIKQVRDILAPTFLIYLFIRFPKVQWPKIIVLIISSCLAIFFGGQRGPFIVLLYAILVGQTINNMHYLKNLKINYLKFILFGITGLIVLINLNQILGRSIDEEIGGSGFLFNGIVQLFYRFFVEVPASNIIIYQFVVEQNFVFGELWLNDLKTLLPGPGVSFSNEIHSQLGGSYEGNAVLGLPLSSYINFGIAGVILVPIIFMYFLNYVDTKIFEINSPSLISIRYVMLCFLPLSYDPTIFLLNGGIVFLGIFIFELYRNFLKKQREL